MCGRGPRQVAPRPDLKRKRQHAPILQVDPADKECSWRPLASRPRRRGQSSTSARPQVAPAGQWSGGSGEGMQAQLLRPRLPVHEHSGSVHAHSRSVHAHSRSVCGQRRSAHEHRDRGQPGATGRSLEQQGVAESGAAGSNRDPPHSVRMRLGVVPTKKTRATQDSTALVRALRHICCP